MLSGLSLGVANGDPRLFRICRLHEEHWSHRRKWSLGVGTMVCRCLAKCMQRRRAINALHLLRSHAWNARPGSKYCSEGYNNYPHPLCWPCMVRLYKCLRQRKNPTISWPNILIPIPYRGDTDIERKMSTAVTFLEPSFLMTGIYLYVYSFFKKRPAPAPFRAHNFYFPEETQTTTFIGFSTDFRASIFLII